MKDRVEDVFREAMYALASCARADEPAASFAAYAWLCDRSAGAPAVALTEEAFTRDAARWANVAVAPELEAYFMASGIKLANASPMMHGKMIKRIIARLWVAMSPDEQAAFIKWTEGKGNA